MTLDDEKKQIERAASAIKNHLKETPRFGVILGSGLGPFADALEIESSIPYEKIPHFEVTKVIGHEGKVIIGRLKEFKDKPPILVYQGRFHFYEGHPLSKVVLPTRVLNHLGIESLLVTNAAGAVNESYQPGELMMIDDHINFTGDNPLFGPNHPDLGPRFPDMTEAYDSKYKETLKASASEIGVKLHSGVYAGLKGPTYETPAEIKMLRALGADATGMSTVPEVIAANHMGMKVAGISCITNMGAGITKEKLSHQEVIDNSKVALSNFTRLVTAFLSKTL